jgi:lipoprotein-anchoring transpeptidase ErfK/SrfK
MNGKILILVMILSFVTFSGVAQQSYIIIDKNARSLYVMANHDTIFSAPVCVGRNIGNKECKGDCKTPEGTFSISQIQNATKWKHDFKDGNGEVRGAYGPWFFRLKTPNWNTIGIHGTCFPNSIGLRESEGCIRLTNSDIKKLKKYIKVGMKVIILPDSIPDSSVSAIVQ